MSLNMKTMAQCPHLKINSDLGIKYAEEGECLVTVALVMQRSSRHYTGEGCGRRNMSKEDCYLVDPASSHMLVSKIKPCMSRSWTLGWVDRSASGVHRSARPFCRRCAPGLNWPGRASGAVTLKKLECSKQAYALDTLAWDNIIGF
ncbi:hypothetical protein G2W53_045218 [Senna tora]|uniref:Uncharacterized protein n=1 Tax=Senna tora TaxID=362788 RepID=A0A834SCY4_9FABA|nr:hypothetical protein G2W53_045218 [Senna tora]